MVQLAERMAAGTEEVRERKRGLGDGDEIQSSPSAPVHEKLGNSLSKELMADAHPEPESASALSETRAELVISPPPAPDQLQAFVERLQGGLNLQSWGPLGDGMG